jgi:hypothetical protein
LRRCALGVAIPSRRLAAWLIGWPGAASRAAAVVGALSRAVRTERRAAVRASLVAVAGRGARARRVCCHIRIVSRLSGRRLARLAQPARGARGRTIALAHACLARAGGHGSRPCPKSEGAE